MPEFRDVAVLEATVTTDTSIYADHDQVGTVLTLADAFPGGCPKRGMIESVSVVDKSSQKSALTLHFFDASPTVASSDNAALNISDAELADKYLGKVEIAAGDYQDLSAAAVATVKALGLIVKSTTTALYCQVESGGTPTYGSTSDLVLKVGLVRG